MVFKFLRAMFPKRLGAARTPRQNACAQHDRPVLAHRAGQLRALTCAAVATLGGCATTQTAQGPAVTTEQREALQQMNYAGSTARNGDVSVRIVRSVLPGDPNYFPKVGAWAEYVFEVQTFGSPLKLQGASIVTREGTPASFARSSSELVEAPSLTKAYAQQAGVLTAATVGGTALAFAGIPFIGPVLMLGALALGPMNADAKMEYEREFRTKMRADLSHMEPNGKVVVSGFFPLIKDARSIVVDYTTGTGFTQPARIEIPLARGSAPSLKSSQASANSQASAPQAVAPAEATTLDSKDAQAILNSIGYAVGVPDGVVGRRTLDAVRRFQQDAGIPITGQLDDATRAALLARKRGLVAAR
jgi:hypothetical protein